MNRCFLPLRSTVDATKKVAACAYFAWVLVGFTYFLTLCCVPALAQSDREGQTLDVPQATIAQPGLRRFPPLALRGKMVVSQAPEIYMDGKPERLSPGARIRGPQNQFLMSAALTGQELIVNYTREPTGGVHEVWILTAEEQKQKLKTATPPRNFIFSSEANAPKVDDGKTPFDQLPKYKQ